MVRATPRKKPSIDRYIWGRGALHFAGIRVVDHEELAKKLGTPAAAEVLLLVIAKECESSPRKWQEAKDLGIPWLEKRWTSLRALMEEYNEAVAEDLNSDKEDATLPDSSESNSPDDNSLLQPLLCAPYLGPPPTGSHRLRLRSADSLHTEGAPPRQDNLCSAGAGGQPDGP